MTPVLVIMAKAPVPGTVKTRLQPVLAPDAAAALHRAFIEDTVAATLALAEGSVEVRLACGPDASHPFFRDLEGRYGIGLMAQGPGNLGMRMQRIQDRCLGEGRDSVVFLGTDSPTLPPDYVQEALRCLEAYPVVLGPAEDGGYYLLGSVRPTPTLFQEIPWGTAQVLADTRERLMESEIAWHELPPWWDVDLPKDLERLQRFIVEHPDCTPQTTRILQELRVGANVPPSFSGGSRVPPR